MFLFFMIQMGTRPGRRQWEGPEQHGSWILYVGVYAEDRCMHLQGHLNTAFANATANCTKSFVMSASCLFSDRVTILFAEEGRLKVTYLRCPSRSAEMPGFILR